MAIETFDKGDEILVTGDFRELDPANPEAPGVLTDPTTVQLRVIKPDGSEVVIPNIRLSIGRFYGLINADMSGSWRWRWQSTGAAQAAEEGRFRVRATKFT